MTEQTNDQMSAPSLPPNAALPAGVTGAPTHAPGQQGAADARSDASGGLLSMDEIVRAKDVTIEKHFTPEWRPGSFVYVKSLSAGEQGQINQMTVSFDIETKTTKTDTSKIDINACLFGMTNEKGEPLFSGPLAGPSLAAKDAKIIKRIADHIRRISAQTQESRDEMKGNSEAVAT